MRIIDAATSLRAGSRKVSVAIGVFDGVHLGHQQVIRQTVSDAEQHEGLPIVVTFDRHPNSVVAPDRTPPLIYPLAQKLQIIESLGVEAVWLIPFDAPFSQIPAEEFIHGLVRDFGHVYSLCVGSAFTFGHRRAGNVALLQKLGEELRVVVHGLAAVSLDGQVVSSTRIRETIRIGDLDGASQMLGRAYSIRGKVVRGDQVGAKLGFPTANLDVEGLCLPPTGVYAVHAAVKGMVHRAVVNIGYRPTFQQPVPKLRFEVHILHYRGELYEREIEIFFVQKIRDEQKFASFEQLQDQIRKDIVRAERVFEE